MRIVIDVSMGVSQLATKNLNIVARPAVIAYGSEEAVGIDCKDIAVCLRRPNRTSLEFNMKAIGGCCSWRWCCCCRCLLRLRCGSLQSAPLTDHTYGKVFA